ncbi:hypothetical protein JCM11491_007221 [Sporobolomyces phaffii]
MDAGLVSAFDGFNLHQKETTVHASNGLTVPGGPTDEPHVVGTLRKQRSQRFTVPLSPPRRTSSSPDVAGLLPSTSLPFQPSPHPVQTQSASPLEELYSTPSNGTTSYHVQQQNKQGPTFAPDTRQEYSGSSESDEDAESRPPFHSLPPSSQQNAIHHLPPPNSHGLRYPQHQAPVFYNSTSHASMPLSPPSLFNLVPGGSPSFTYHHSFPSNSPPTQHYQPPHQTSSYPTFVPRPAPTQGYANNFGLGVGADEVGLPYGMGAPSMALGMGGMSNPGPRRDPSPGYQTDADDDEIIETAIVIKSIPFSCPKDQLLSLMTSLQLPAPLAFNYHYDLSLNPSPQPQEPRQDQFRGLAFANFRNGEEARMVVFALNGFEFMGRKLRAEFKKVLKPGEKEAIERNKALKRIRSVQLLANGNGSNNGSNGGYGRGNNGNGWGDIAGGPSNANRGGAWNRRDAPGGGNGGHYRAYEPDEATTEEYGRMLHSHSQSQSLHNKTSFGQREYVVPSGIGMAYGDSGESLGGGSGSVDMSGSTSGSGSLMSSGAGTGGGPRSACGSDSEEGVGSSVSAREERKKDLDLNDPQTLQLYSQLLLFSSSPSPPNPTTTEFEGVDALQRRKLKMVAKMLGLGYGSEETLGGGKRVRLWKTNTEPPLRATASAMPLRRPASTSSFHSTPTASNSFAPPPVPALPAFSAYLAAPGSGGLRGKKSMPEFRPSSSSSFYAGSDAPPMPSVNPYSRPQMSSFARKSTTNLRSESPSQYSAHTISSFPSPSRRVREIASVQGLFQQQGILPDASPQSLADEKKEYYSTGLGSIGTGAEAVLVSSNVIISAALPNQSARISVPFSTTELFGRSSDGFEARLTTAGAACARYAREAASLIYGALKTSVWAACLVQAISLGPQEAENLAQEMIRSARNPKVYVFWLIPMDEESRLCGAAGDDRIRLRSEVTEDSAPEDPDWWTLNVESSPAPQRSVQHNLSPARRFPLSTRQSLNYEMSHTRF